MRDELGGAKAQHNDKDVNAEAMSVVKSLSALGDYAGGIWNRGYAVIAMPYGPSDPGNCRALIPILTAPETFRRAKEGI